jgi:hypothetical protein
LSSVLEQLELAKNPREAVILLARAIDAINDRIDEEVGNAGGWDSWDVEAPEIHTGPENPAADEIHEQIRQVEDQISKTPDPEDAIALEAKLRLLKDQLGPPVEEVDTDGARAEQEVGEAGDVVVSLPEAPEETKKQRKQFAEEMLHLDEHFGSQDFNDAYVIGGPLWLYYGNRDFVVGLPPEYKKAMVADVQSFSPGEALEMGRDILKDESANPATMEDLFSG